MDITKADFREKGLLGEEAQDRAARRRLESGIDVDEEKDY